MLEVVLALALATLTSGLLQQLVGMDQLLLIFFTAIVIIALRQGMGASLWTVVGSFLIVNLLFTEPRFSLRMFHVYDVVSLVWFVTVAVLVGRMASKYRDKMRQLLQRERFSQLERQLLQALVRNNHDEDLISLLLKSLTELDNLKCYALPIDKDNHIDWRPVKDMNERLPDRVQQLLRDSDAKIALPSLKIGRWLLTSVTDGAKARWLIVIDMSLVADTSSIVDSVSLLVQQTRLAVERLRLATDIAQERVEKERELLRSALLSSISHDFRTPLTSMVGAATTLEELSEDLSSDDQKELLETIIVEARRLDRYTSNLLDMTRLGRGELTLDRVWTSIDEVLNVVRKRIEPERGDVKIVFDVPDNSPQIRLHPALIEHALFNVLHNAIKFSQSGDTVHLKVFATPDAIIIDVSDSGPGIAIEDREKVFEMFYTATSGDRRQAGSGLGLAICKGMIGAHGGSVTIDDSESGGCLVRIELPLQRAESASADTDRLNGGMK